MGLNKKWLLRTLDAWLLVLLQTISTAHMFVNILEILCIYKIITMQSDGVNNSAQFIYI